MTIIGSYCECDIDYDDLGYCIDYFFKCFFASVFVVFLLTLYLIISGHI